MPCKRKASQALSLKVIVIDSVLIPATKRFCGAVKECNADHEEPPLSRLSITVPFSSRVPIEVDPLVKTIFR